MSSRSTEALKKKHKEKIGKGCSEQEAATKGTLRSGELEELQGAHGGGKQDQEGLPWSLNSRARAHKVAQGAIIAIGSRVWWTSM